MPPAAQLGTILAILFIHCGTFAQNLNLHEALEMARGHSPELQRAEAARDESHWKKVGTFSGFLPHVSASANYLVEHKYMFTDIDLGSPPAHMSIPNIVPTTLYSLDARLNLFDGFASWNRLRSSIQYEEASDEELKWTRFRLDRAVVVAYYRALAAKTLREAAEQNLKTLKDHLREAQLLKKTGLSTNYDVLQVEVQVSLAESETLSSEDNVAQTQAELASTLGLEQVPSPQGVLPELKADLIRDVKPDETKERGDLKALQHRATGADWERKALNRFWVPKIGAFGSVQYYNNLTEGFDDGKSIRNAYQVGVSLQWDLFDGMASIAQANEAVARKIQSEKTLASANLKAHENLNFWTHKYAYFCSVMKARQNDLGKARESVRLAREGRHAGVRTNTDLLDAESEVFKAQAGAINAQLGAVEALINVELNSGQRIYQFD